jgi:hypothetical protein
MHAMFELLGGLLEIIWNGIADERRIRRRRRQQAIDLTNRHTPDVSS